MKVGAAEIEPRQVELAELGAGEFGPRALPAAGFNQLEVLGEGVWERARRRLGEF